MAPVSVATAVFRCQVLIADLVIGTEIVVTIIPSATTNDISNNVNPLLRRAIFSKPLVRNMETHSRNATPNRIAPYAQRFEHFTQKSVLPSCNEFGARSFLRQMKNNLAKCQ